MNITGTESCQAAINPVIALVDPGPVVTIAQPKFFVILYMR